jgi:hypothetical protein
MAPVHIFCFILTSTSLCDLDFGGRDLDYARDT